MRFEEYIVRNNPDDVLVILKELGAPKPKDDKDMLRLLFKAVDKFPERTFSLLSEIETPYKQLILSQIQPETIPVGKHSNCSGSSNCSGCKCGSANVSSCDGGCGSNADGTTTNNTPPAPVVTTSDSDKTPFVMPSFITQHPYISGALGTIAVTLLIVGAVKLLK